MRRKFSFYMAKKNAHEERFFINVLLARRYRGYPTYS